jgi:hypothetical protein
MTFLRTPSRSLIEGSQALEDAKGECGLADYQALGERAREGWRQASHHYFTMVMLPMRFIDEERVARQPSLELPPPRAIAEMLKETLRDKPEAKAALTARMVMSWPGRYPRGR